MKEDRIKIVEFPSKSIESPSLGTLLRELADQVDAGEFGVTNRAIAIFENEEGEIHTLGLGDTNPYVMIALAALGMRSMM